MVTRYGYDVLLAAVVIALALAAAAFFFVEWKPVRFGVPCIALLFLGFTVWFFRDPERLTPSGDGLVISPADGEVVLVAPVQESEFIHGEATQVSIFMSPLNVHVNRYPISGTVRYFKHIPGEFLVAFDDKSSLRNERTHIGVENAGMKVFFKQIAGFVARRIVAEVNEGDSAVAGKRFGMIKFGSRVDVIVPKGLEIRVSVGQRTIAGETILAALRP